MRERINRKLAQLRHPDTHREERRRYKQRDRQRHPEKWLARYRRQGASAAYRAWYEKNYAKLYAKSRAWLLAHPERVREFQRRSREKITPSYCRRLLNRDAPVQIPRNAFPPQLLAAKRVHLQLKRLLREVRP